MFAPLPQQTLSGVLTADGDRVLARTQRWVSAEVENCKAKMVMDGCGIQGFFITLQKPH